MKDPNEIAFEETRRELDFQSQLYTETKTAGTFAVTVAAVVATVTSAQGPASPISPDDHVEGYVDALLPSRAVLVLTAESEYLAIGGRFPS